MNDLTRMEKKDFPGLYQAADAESARKQRYYFITLGCFFCSLVLGAIASLFSSISWLMNLISAIFLSFSLFLSGLSAWKRFDRSWYSARAVAESVKTRTWRYMMRAEPFNVADDRAEDIFLSDLRDILSNNREVTKELCDESADRDPVSPRMRQIRTMPMETRREICLENRVTNQGNWYRQKAKEKKSAGNIWFFIVVGLNALAIVCALLRIQFIQWTYLPTGVLTVAAASAVSWLQTKRFTDLATSYALAANEINIIRARGSRVSSESDLCEYVLDSENAFSREHTQWAARRGAACQNDTCK